MSDVVSSVLTWVGLSPFVSDQPLAPINSPALWAVLAWARRQNQQTLIDETPPVIKTPAQNSQTVDGVVTENAALSALVTEDVALAAVAAPPAFVQVNAATPQTNQSSVAVTYTSAQTAGDTNILAIGWNNATSNITSVTDSAGNAYQLAVPTARGSGVSQAIYYAPNIKAAAGRNQHRDRTFNTATPYVDIRALEYSGLDPVNPFDIGTSASGTGTSANSGTVTTTAANALIFGAGMTTGSFGAAPAPFTTRIITNPDADIAQDRIVTTTGAYSATAPLSGSAPGSCRSRRSGRRVRPAAMSTPPTAVITAPSRRDRLGHGDPHRHRLRQCGRGRGAVPGGQQSRWPPRTPPRPTVCRGTPRRWPTAPTP